MLFRSTNRNPRPGDVRDSQNDATLLRSLFPSIIPTDFETGVSKTLKWLSDDGQLVAGQSIDSN